MKDENIDKIKRKEEARMNCNTFWGNILASKEVKLRLSERLYEKIKEIQEDWGNRVVSIKMKDEAIISDDEIYLLTKLFQTEKFMISATLHGSLDIDFREIKFPEIKLPEKEEGGKKI
ncbi:TPA: hypothetical protein DCZ46_01310 [Candidatus Campbellbacteria bacterium]|nr:MAG: hypothetical protein UR58_C0001G0237 [Candidatus Campbellbacteria bacterium GW2011_OD1_34_28]HAP73892.1 hypothetical protein [Candidatus Campbellbacteria bacterium]HAQ02240.1 hypothetical protein [Candidatus Campbellbacteria bacterium]HBC70587.1 hypothetical protein [Candidatus Campbellbacteria bacterium]